MDWVSVLSLSLGILVNISAVGYTIVSSKIQIKYLQDQVKGLEEDLKSMRTLDADIKVLQTKVDGLHTCLLDIRKALERRHEIREEVQGMQRDSTN